MSTSPETIHKTPSNSSGMRAENTADDSDQIIIHLRKAADETIFGAAIDGERIGFNKTELCWLGSLMLLGENGVSMKDITGGEQPSVMRLIEIQAAWKSLSSKLEEASAGTVIVESLVIDDVMRYRIPNVLYQYQSELPVKANPPLKQQVVLTRGPKQDDVIDDEDLPTSPTAERQKGKKMGPIDRSEFTIINLDEIEENTHGSAQSLEDLIQGIEKTRSIKEKFKKVAIRFAKDVTPKDATPELLALIRYVGTGKKARGFRIIQTPTETIEQLKRIVDTNESYQTPEIHRRLQVLEQTLLSRQQPSTETCRHPSKNNSPTIRHNISSILGIEALPWANEAKCLQAEPDTFYPEKGGSTREAKLICNGIKGKIGACAVQEQCLEYALENEERFGVWGGLSERERRKLKRFAS